MPLKFEELEVLRKAEGIADNIWRDVVRWEPFASEVVGRQLARSADSIGANIAEAFGRFHYGEKLQFLYYARGSLYETKYWLNRAIERDLLPLNSGQSYASDLTDLARQLNSSLSTLKNLRRDIKMRSNKIREEGSEYVSETNHNKRESLFSNEELEWLDLVESPNS
jgi:four helix bundle protein